MSEIDKTPASATTVEQTSKRLKLYQMLAVLLIVVGGVWTWTAVQSGTDAGTGAIILVIGLLLYFVTRFRIWWHHK